MTREVWDVAMELAGLRNAAAHWGVELIAESASRMCMPVTRECPRCRQPQVAMFSNAGCGHLACARCWTSCVEMQLSCGEATDKMCVPCGHQGCAQDVSWGLVRGICTRYSGVVRQRVAAVDSAFRSAQERRSCPQCGEIAHIFYTNRGCGHTACEGCWVHRIDAEMTALPPNRPCPDVFCVHRGCRTPISGVLRSRIFEASEEVSTLEAVVRADLPMTLPQSASAARIVCSHCQKLTWGLILSSCGHQACWRCWRADFESQVSSCLHECRLQMSCACGSSKCTELADPNFVGILCSHSHILRRYNAEVSEQFASLKAIADTGVQVIEPLRSGSAPMCTICCEPCWWLLASGHCGHGACERCLATWAEGQIHRCELERRDVGRCFAPGCQERTSVALAVHLETRSTPLKVFSRRTEVAQRRRLRSNELFPAQLQQDCPRPGCWGLGYLGFDTVMCFMCEETWSPEEAGVPIPIDNDVEEVMGVKVKKCPKCSEYIEKNGGCDHMTCRCGYQFWWTTLAPYRR